MNSTLLGLGCLTFVLRVKVDIVLGQPMKTKGWHYANLLH